MKKSVLSFGSLVSFLLLFPVVTFAQTFTDVDETFPHYEAVEWAASENIVKGFDDVSFRPNQEVTRAEFLKLVLLRKYTQKEIDDFEVLEEKFSDVSKDDWFYQYVYFAVSGGIVNGYEDGSFKPYQHIHTWETAKIIVNTLVEYTAPSDEKWWVNSYFAKLNDKFNIRFEEYTDRTALERSMMVDILYRMEYLYLDDRYYEKDNFVYYYTYSNKMIKLENSNSQYFEIIPHEKTFYEGRIARDENYIYINEIPIEELDINSAEILQGGVIRDENYYYFATRRLDTIDYDSFELINPEDSYYGFYAKDKNRLYFLGQMASASDEVKIIEKSDLSTFELIFLNEYPPIYAKDNNNYYKSGESIQKSDLPFKCNEFLGIRAYQSFNDKVYYLCEKEVLGSDLESFSFFSYGFGHAAEGVIGLDKNNIYVSEKKIEGISPNGLFHVKNKYLKNSKVVFYIDRSGDVKILDSVDYDSFEVPDSEYFHDYAVDENIIYFQGQVIENSDGKTFEYLGAKYYEDIMMSFEYIKDKNYFYKIDWKEFRYEIVSKSEVPSELLQE